jgi:hypothetical protein
LFANELPMSREDYCEGMEHLARDVPALRKARLEATYFARRILNWRGHMLRLTYDVFLGGLFLAVFAFVIAAFHK